MKLKDVAVRLAAENGVSTRKAERLMEAELRLITEAYPVLKNMTKEQLIQNRFASDPATNEIAAIEMVPLIMSVYESPDLMVKPALMAAVQEYAEAVEDSGIAPEFLGHTWHVLTYEDIRQGIKDKKYSGNWSEIEEAIRKTAGLRGAREDVNEKFQELLEKGFDKDEYNEYIRSIQDEIDNYMYSPGGAYVSTVVNE